MTGAADAADDAARLITLAGSLIAEPTPNPPGEEIRLAERVARLLTARGFEAELHPLDGEDGARRANVLARVPGRGTQPPLVWCGHLDTVPAGAGWSRDPYTAAVADGRLYGLGAADMKAAIAAMIAAAERLAALPGGLPGDVLLAFTSGEETRSAGARALARSGLLDGAAGLVIGEPTANRAGVAEKGGIWIEVELRGRTSHGSLPHLGANAAAGLAEVALLLERAATGATGATIDAVEPDLGGAVAQLNRALSRPEHPLLGAPTLTLTRLEGGVATNVVPDLASAEFDVRTLPGQRGSDVLAAVAAVAERVAERRGLRAAVRSLGERVALETAADHPLVQATLGAIADATGTAGERCGLTGATDATELVPAFGIPFVICGPGAMAQAHQPDEFVSLTALRQAVEIYARLAQRFWALDTRPAGG